MVRELVNRLARHWSSWRPEERDAVLYAASALFCVAVFETSSIALYRQWAELAVGPYAVGAVGSAVLARRRPARPSPRSWHWTTPRLALFLVVLIGATLGPLSLEVLWRNEGVKTSTAHVQPEVEVVEQSGMRLAEGKDPYRLLNPHHLPPVPAGQPAYDAFDPYLPLMAVFGIARGTDIPGRLSDARVLFSLLTVLLVVAALALCRGPTAPRLLTLQTMTVLPTAALPLATGGDDMPIVALLLLGVVLLQRRRPLAAGVVLGAAAAMKLTAWPLAFLAVLVARDRRGQRSRRARLLLTAGLVGVVAPAVLPSVVANVPAFVENVVRFPLGLAGVTSPASTPLLGHLLVAAFPHLHRVITVAAVVVGGLVLLFLLVRRTPQVPSQLVRLLAWAMAVAIVLAPTTRIGYVLYPIDFFAWAWLLRAEEGVEQEREAGIVAEAVAIVASVSAEAGGVSAGRSQMAAVAGAGAATAGPSGVTPPG
jgi:hypothetical protein